jgi:hypothetical protein
VPSVPIACRVFGHRPRFRAEGAVMSWECERGCGMQGEKSYESPAEARRYAGALDRGSWSTLGKRAPVSLFVLRLARRRRT